VTQPCQSQYIWLKIEATHQSINLKALNPVGLRIGIEVTPWCMSRPAGVGNNDIESSESLHRMVDDTCAGFGARDVGDDEGAFDIVRF
jgi:hypothetical protein